MDIRERSEVCMSEQKVKVMISFQVGHENGGPYISHQRIQEVMSDKYEYYSLMVPQGRLKIYNPKLQRELRKQIKKVNPDIVHVNGLELIGFQLVLAAAKEKKKIVLAIHGFVNEAIKYEKWKKKIVNLCEKYALKKADIIYCVSDYVRNQEWLKKYEKKIYGTIYNMSHKKQGVASEDIRKKYNIKSDDIVIVSTGRISREKGYEDLCNAIIKWNPTTNIKFLIVGEGEYLERFKDRIANSKQNGQVIFTGFQKDVTPYLKASDMFTICTLHETLCNSILEAQKEGLPVVATDVGGIPEIIENGKNGFLFEKGNIEQIICLLGKLCAKESLRQQMGENAKHIMEIKFSENIVKKQVEEMYKKILE